MRMRMEKNAITAYYTVNEPEAKRTLDTSPE